MELVKQALKASEISTRQEVSPWDSPVSMEMLDTGAEVGDVG